MSRFFAAMAAIAIATSALAAAPAEVPRFPASVTTIDGAELNVAALAGSSTLVVVTLKATSCPVCQQQLARLRQRADALAQCGVSFLVLAPGPRAELAAIRERTGFEHPFVEDRNLEIAGTLGLRMSADEIVPAILLLEPDLTVGWIQQGRNAVNYGDAALIERLDCAGKIAI